MARAYTEQRVGVQNGTGQGGTAAFLAASNKTATQLLYGTLFWFSSLCFGCIAFHYIIVGVHFCVYHHDKEWKLPDTFSSATLVLLVWFFFPLGLAQSGLIALYEPTPWHAKVVAVLVLLSLVGTYVHVLYTVWHSLAHDHIVEVQEQANSDHAKMKHHFHCNKHVVRCWKYVGPAPHTA